MNLKKFFLLMIVLTTTIFSKSKNLEPFYYESKNLKIKIEMTNYWASKIEFVEKINNLEAYYIGESQNSKEMGKIFLFGITTNQGLEKNENINIITPITISNEKSKYSIYTIKTVNPYLLLTGNKKRKEKKKAKNDFKNIITIQSYPERIIKSVEYIK